MRFGKYDADDATSEDNVVERAANRMRTEVRARRLRLVEFCIALCAFLAAFSTTGQLQSGTTVNFADVHQRIDGFGAADVWNPALTDAQADLFFSPTNGIGLSILRVGIDENGNDLSAYSNATKAVARGAVVWGAPWTAPAAWKDNNSTTNGGHLLPAYYDSWASRLAGFATKMQQSAGVPLWGVSVQNEPDYTASYVSMLYSNTEMLNFVKVLGPKLAALNPRPKLLMPDVSSWGGAWGFSGPILSDSTAAPYLDVIAVHQYAGVSSPQTTARPIWETEMSTFDGFDPGIFNGVGVAKMIHDAITTGGVSAWHYWWLIGLNGDNEGLIGSNGSTTITKRLYTMGNFSRFVRPGFVVVGTTGAPAGVYITAYQNPSTGAFVIVAINQNGSDVPVSVTLNGVSATSVTPWVTSGSLNLGQQTALSLSAGSFTTTLPTYSVTSFVGTGSAAVAPPSAPTNLHILP
jgi:glucuronoarabinoxylan endo-1,4-beta-xylanase